MTARRLVQLAARAAIVLFSAALLSIVGVQYVHIIQRNVAYAAQLHGVENDIAALSAKKVEQEREISRLSDPHGAIPEIHDRLHLVGDHEEIIYLKRHDTPDRP